MTATEAVNLLYAISRETNMPAASHDTCSAAYFIEAFLDV